MTWGRPSRTRATSELVVPRSMPMGRGLALGSKISRRDMVFGGAGARGDRPRWGPLLSGIRSSLGSDLVFDGGALVEEAPHVAQLAERWQRCGDLLGIATG